MGEKFVLDHKEDIWKIPPETRALRINCKLNRHSAERIIERCREIEKIIFAGPAYSFTNPETIKYLSKLAFLSVAGHIKKHPVNKETEEKVRELYARGDHNLHTLSLRFKLTPEEVWHIVHEKG